MKIPAKPISNKELVSRFKKKFWILKKRPALIKLLWSIPIFSVILFLTGFSYLYLYTSDLKDKNGKPLNWEKLENKDLKKSSLVFESNGELIGRFFYEVRDPINYNETPKILINGFIAAEDQRFFSHHGIDIYAIGRAAFFNSLRWAGFKYGPRAGASTITQQYARLRFSEDIDEFKTRKQSYLRKIKEAKVAIQIERRLLKQKILESFLSNIYLGHGTNGISEAARFYFGKDIGKNAPTLQEVAILASLNKSPQKYCPIFHEPERPQLTEKASAEEKKEEEKKYDKSLAEETVRVTLAKERYNWALERMYDEGYISKNELQSSFFKKDAPLVLPIVRITPIKNSEFGYGSRMVKEMLLVNGHKDSEISYVGGLKIKTTFDSSLQKIASEELNRQLTELNKELPLGSERIEGAVIILENKTGNIVSLSGGHNFSETQFNRAISLRSPGSAFKPFTYAAAFEFFGRDFDDKICNCPFTMPGKIDFNGRVIKWWSPENFKEANPVPYGYIPLPIGLVRSVNLATLNLARSINMGSVIELAHDMGIWGNQKTLRDPGGEIIFTTPDAKNNNNVGLSPYLPTAIGASDVNLLELVSAYSIFARDGIYIKPKIIQEVRDSSGKIIYKAEEPDPEIVLSEETSRKITVLLRAVTKIGTAKISMRNIVQQVAVKTGTSNGPFDLSTVGYTPEFTIGIRFGYDLPKIIDVPEYMKKMSGDKNMQVSGGWVAGPVFRRIVDRIYEKRLKVKFSSEIESNLRDLISKIG